MKYTYKPLDHDLTTSQKDAIEGERGQSLGMPLRHVQSPCICIQYSCTECTRQYIHILQASFGGNLPKAWSGHLPDIFSTREQVQYCHLRHDQVMYKPITLKLAHVL